MDHPDSDKTTPEKAAEFIDKTGWIHKADKLILSTQQPQITCRNKVKHLFAGAFFSCNAYMLPWPETAEDSKKYE